MKLVVSVLLVTASAFVDSAVAQSAAPASASGAPVSMCIGCHAIPGYQASFPLVYRVPKIGGQKPQYIEAALKAYKQGARNNPSMTAIAKGLTDQQIAQLATYYAERGDAPIVSAAAK